jgi:hypothetical protein
MSKELKYRIKAIVSERADSRSARGAMFAALADQAGLSTNHVRKISNYKLEEGNEARMEDLVAFAEVLGVPPVELLHPTLRTKIVDVFTH